MKNYWNWLIVIYTYYWQKIYHNVLIRTTVLFMHYHCRNEVGDFATSQIVNINMWKGIFMLEAQKTFFVPQTIGTRNVAVKNQTIAKPSMYWTNCHRTNHNIETYRSKKKEEHIIATTKATTHVGKPLRPINYPCHICGIVGHKLTNCPRFNEMQSMFKDKGSQSTKFKPRTEVNCYLS
jgi:hypothetical protein